MNTLFEKIGWTRGRYGFFYNPYTIIVAIGACSIDD
jgi:hypothetical protein